MSEHFVENFSFKSDPKSINTALPGPAVGSPGSIGGKMVAGALGGEPRQDSVVGLPAARPMAWIFSHFQVPARQFRLYL